MLQRLYVHNFRCFENFELIFKEMPSALLIGENGTGKSTVASALEIIQSIGRGVNRVGELVKMKDFTRDRSDVPIRFEIEVLIKEKLYRYDLALELPEGFKELRVAEENLTVAGDPVYSRTQAQVVLHAGVGSTRARNPAQFRVDWHLVALPIIQEQSERDPLHLFKTWLSRMIILAPIPPLMTGDSGGETLAPNKRSTNFGEWFTGLLIHYPAAYTEIEKYLREVMPDMRDFLNEPTGRDSYSMIVRFEAHNADLSIYYKDLSDGEKCFFLCALVIAANKFYGPLFCFWDEPDNYLSISEAGHFIASLRRSFSGGGQFVATSHNPVAIQKFSNENTLLLYRKSHLEPTLVRSLSDIPLKGSLIDALIRGDVVDELE